MIKEAIEKILELAAPITVEADPAKADRQQYVKIGNSLEPLNNPNTPEALKFFTLNGLVAYLKENKDGLNQGSLVIHVESHERVSVRGKANGPWFVRDIHAVAEVCEEKRGSGRLEFGNYYEPDFFVTMLMAQFQVTEDLKKVQQIAGNVSGEKVTTSIDDGITQNVVMKSGVALTQRAEIVNPFLLAPFRTFTEVKQPVSPFVFRVKQQRDGEAPKCALFEADGGHWKNLAIDSIALLLTGLLEDSDVKVPVLK